MTDCEVLSETDTEIERLVTFKSGGSKPGGKAKEKVVLKKPMKVCLLSLSPIQLLSGRERIPIFLQGKVVDALCRRISIKITVP